MDAVALAGGVLRSAGALKRPKAKVTQNTDVNSPKMTQPFRLFPSVPQSVESPMRMRTMVTIGQSCFQSQPNVVQAQTVPMPSFHRRKAVVGSADNTVKRSPAWSPHDEDAPAMTRPPSSACS